ncbi:hypothetical protein [Paenibacillus sp. HJGM_3]|uniref:hypothetical protein n=1 Tax=Paenibacillus sp. HJGM_3 TaxID=3379816 RepID=UPI003858E8AA
MFISRMIKIGLIVSACSAIAIFMLVAAATPAMASNNPWYDKFISWESVNATKIDDIKTNPYSENLGWWEGYVLKSYMNMYDLTHDTSWLDKIVDHTDSVISTATDIDGDGYLGWGTGAYAGVQLVTNGGFETAASGDQLLPAGWTRFQSTSATAYRGSGSAAYSGTYGIALKTNPSAGWQKMTQTLPTYVPNAPYTFIFAGRTNGSAAKGKAIVYNATTGTVLASAVVDNTTFQVFTLRFKAPSVAGQTLQVHFQHNDYTVADGWAYFDAASVAPYYPYMVHESNLMVPVAQFIRTVKQTPSLQAAYLSKANTYQSFIENEIVPKWESSSFIGNTWVNVGTTEGYYKEPPNFDSLPGNVNPLPYNMMLSMSDLLLTMYDVNANASYLDKSKRMNTYWKNNLFLQNSNSAYNWYYAEWPSPGIEDTSHGDLDVVSALGMFNHGLVFGGTDMDKFTSTFVDVMWNGSTSSSLVDDKVDGLSGNYGDTKMIFGFVNLAQFNNNAWVAAARQYNGYNMGSSSVHAVEALTLTEIMKWDPVKLVNQGFELDSSADSTLPSRWTRVGSTSATAYQDSANKSTGAYGMTLVSNGSTPQTVYQRWEEEVASATYVVTFDGKTDGSGAGGKVWVYDETTGTTLGSVTFTSTSWQPYTFTFTAPSVTNHVLKVYLGHNNIAVNGKTYFDNVVVKRQGDAW